MPPEGHSREGVYPLSPMQHAMLYHHLSASQSDADMVQVVCELREELDVDRFAAAWNAVATRHQPFRTRFHWDGLEMPTQEVLRRVDLRPEVLDWRERTADVRDEALRTLLNDDRDRGFDLTIAPAMRLKLVRWADAEWRCVWSWPHILLDGRSLPIVLGEVFDLYDGRIEAPDMPAAPQYSELLAWLPRRDGAGEERYWRELLAGLPGPTPLPGSEAGTSDRGSGRGAQVTRLTREETGAIGELAKSIGVTGNAVMQGAWALLLARYCGVDDVVFGAARASRRGTIPNADRAVGLFITTVPVRARYTPEQSVRDWLVGLRQQHVAVRPYEYASLTDIQRWSGLEAGQPVHESAVIFEWTALDQAMHNEHPAWTHRRFWLTEPTPVPLSVYGFGGEQLDVKLLYDRDRVGDGTAAQVLEHLVMLLRELPKDPDRALGDVPMLTRAERQRQLEQWNATDGPAYANRTVHGFIEAQVRQTPDLPAVTDGSTTLTYRDLDSRANRVGHRLRRMGVGPDTRVGVSVDRSVDLVVAALGVLKAGGAYVPLDPDYPNERLEYMARDAGLVAVVTAGSNVSREGIPVLDLASDANALAEESSEPVSTEVTAEHLAYVIYTSGSTGRPKGVMVEHRNVANFFAAMDARIPHGAGGTWLAVTSLAFDISVLELLWPLTRGFKVVVGSPVSSAAIQRPAGTGLEFSLFYFASGEDGEQEDKYRLLTSGARFADERGFHAVWTPERHFHAFGGLYPNPSVASAALAVITSRLRIRAGSVVLPLHHPIRVAEEWALVDNLSGGRVDLSFASGWQPNDFVLSPEAYADRKRVMLDGIDVVRRLWRGEAVTVPGPGGKPVDVRTLPRPIQRELPVWITTAGSAETYRAAGEAGANILTHLLGQTVDDVAAMIQVYREGRAAAGHAGPGCVTLMLHAFVGDDDDAVRETVREPMKRYLRSSVSLIKGFAGAWIARRGTSPSAAGDEFDTLSPEDMESLLDFAFERYFETSGLFGTPARCVELAQRLRSAGVDEIACLIDFGVPTEQVLSHLEDLDRVRREVTRATRAAAAPALSTLMRDHEVTHLQCTPSLARMLLADDETRAALGALEVLLVGGEPLPGLLAAELRRNAGGPVFNMYGPTETTVWSSMYEVGDERGTVPIGRPIANTRLYVLDRHGDPVPVGVPGELYIGGAGVVRGYLGRPELTNERFIPDRFSASGRLYRTGDVVRWRGDGVLEFLGRADNQVKIRGHRIELGEIEAVLAVHPDVGDVVVNPWQRADGDAVLVAYVVPANGHELSDAALRAHAEAQLPGAMIPSHVVTLARLPLTPNGKVDRKALPIPGADGSAKRGGAETQEAPATALEELVAGIWRTVLGVDRIGRKDRFFELGGNSLTTIQVATRLREMLGIDVPLRVIFDTPTVADLAADLERRLLESADAEALENLLDEVEHQTVGAQRTA